MNLGEILHEQKQDLLAFHAYFKSRPFFTTEEKMEKLRNMASKIYFKRKNSLRRFRKHFDENYQNMFKLPCFVCGSRCEHRHHIIPLINGGINSSKNRIPLCRNCHIKVHPWMTI